MSPMALISWAVLQRGRAPESAEWSEPWEDVQGEQIASTGPRSGERGVLGEAAAQVLREAASTGPRSGERGVGSTRCTPRRGCIGFNGAALRRARSELADAVEITAAQGFNGAALRRARSEIELGRGQIFEISFNGAALRRARSGLVLLSFTR